MHLKIPVRALIFDKRTSIVVTLHERLLPLCHPCEGRGPAAELDSGLRPNDEEVRVFR
jgi:hypothetical protein